MNEKRSSRIEAKFRLFPLWITYVIILSLALLRIHHVAWSVRPVNSLTPSERGHSCPRPATIHIRGPLVDEPQQRSRSTVSLLISAQEIRIDKDPTWQPANGELFEIRVFTRKSNTQTGRIVDQLPDVTTPTACGARIEAETRSRVSRAPQPGRVQHLGRTWRFRRPPAGTLHAYWKKVRILEAPPVRTPAHQLRSFKVQLCNAYQERFSDPVYRLAAGATLGDRGPVREGIYHNRPIARLFAHAGLGHVLAVSGLHVGTLAGAALWLMSRLHVARRRRILPLAIVLGLFFFLTGGRPATARAVIMTLVGVHSYAARRAGLRVSAWRGITTAAVILLLYEPHLLFDMGSQLSFMAVLSLIGLTRPIQATLDRRLRRFGWARLPRNLRTLIAAQIAIQLGMVIPFSSLYFGRFSVAGIFVNLLAIPLIGVFVPAALLTSLLYLVPFVGPVLAWVPGCCAELVGRLFFAIAHLGASLFPYPAIPRVPWFALLPYYALLIVFACHRRELQKRGCNASGELSRTIQSQFRLQRRLATGSRRHGRSIPHVTASPPASDTEPGK